MVELLKESFYHVTGVDKLSRKEHSHKDTYELIQILNGEGEFIIFSKIYHFKPGTVLLIDAENFHYSAPQDSKTYTRNKLIFCKSAFSNIIDTFGLRTQLERLFDNHYGASVLLHEKDALAIDKLFQVVCDGQDPFQCARAFIDIVNALCTKTRPNTNQSSIIATILERINESVGNDFSLDSLSNSVGLSRYYLCHFFKAKTGMTIMDYLKWKRIDMAKQLLAESENSISKIAYTCGYNSPAYFSSCFKEVTGMTPKAYANSIKR